MKENKFKEGDKVDLKIDELGYLGLGYYIEDECIEEKYIMHGNTKVNKTNKFGEVVCYVPGRGGEYVIIKYLDIYNSTVQLGFKEEDLVLIESGTKDNVIGMYEIY